PRAPEDLRPQRVHHEVGALDAGRLRQAQAVVGHEVDVVVVKGPGGGAAVLVDDAQLDRLAGYDEVLPQPTGDPGGGRGGEGAGGAGAGGARGRAHRGGAVERRTGA